MTTSPDTTAPMDFPAYARLQDGTLTLGNAIIERAWRVGGAGLIPLRLTDKRSGFEWIAAPALSDVGSAPAVLEQQQEEGGVGEPFMAATLRVATDGQSASAVYHFRVPVTVPAVSLWMGQSDGEASPLLETFTLVPLHLRFVQVELHDQTDEHNELAFEREWLLHPAERALSLSGCLFWFEDVLTGHGLVVLKEASLPHVRPQLGPFDLRVTGKREVTLATVPGIAEAGHRTTLLCYEGGAIGRVGALQNYQRSRRSYQPVRDGLFLSNTWGDRGQDGKVNAAFLAQEIGAAAALGVDVVQIDDGWQAGKTINSVQAGGQWEGFRSDPDFWKPHPTRFPEGLEPIVNAAHAAGMHIGLWFAPDSTDDFAHWQEDAQTLLSLYRAHGIRYFKLDGIKIRSAQGDAALHRLLDTLLRESGGQIVCDLDVTAETRPGYFGALDIGPLFVENRYTDWHGYWPHQTLRNLWKLAHYIDPLRLRMEVLNPERNTNLYVNDPLAPACYDPAYLFAVTCFACPLGWFETSGLSEAYVASIAPFVAVWKAHRERIYGGTVLPVGQTPDGTSWTGFMSISADSCYLLMFREWNSAAAYSFPCPLAAGHYQAETLYGNGAIQVSGATVTVEIQNAQSFVLARLTPQSFSVS